MSVYVDEPLFPYGRMVMCHMIADSLDELHAMADNIGVKRRWFQGDGHSWPHYDICKSKRRLAVEAGALDLPRREFGLKLRGMRRALRREEGTG